ncbi:MAG: class I SAM-dependent methyltransferase [Actinobacteria bacterium]|nr:class I SAM-dependent methyltransferase [Actinomycetota bacterium]
MLSPRKVLRDKLLRLVEEAVERVSARRHDELRAELRAWERRTRRDVWTALEQEAARSSAELVRTSMHALTLSTHPHQTLREALRAAPESGMSLEFGVATGTTLRIIAEERTGGVYGFDSFDGLPQDWRLGYDAGEFAHEIPAVRGAEIVVGLFADTLPGFLASHPDPVAFVHIDCDLYSSTAEVLEQLTPRLVDGTVLLFDEYYNFPGWQQHEHRAWCEYVERTGLEFEYAGLTMDDEQVWVRVTGVPPS